MNLAASPDQPQPSAKQMRELTLRGCEVARMSAAAIAAGISTGAAQALDFREFHPGKGTDCAREVIRRYVKHLNIDRPLYNDHNAMQQLVKSGEILNEVENTVGVLG